MFQDQILSWLCNDVTSKEILVVEHSSYPDFPENIKFFILSYEMASKLSSILINHNFKIVICDESHYLKNSNALRTQNILPIVKQAQRALLLSGTPALSRPFELFTQLNALNSNVWPESKDFFIRYCKKGKK